MSLSGRGLERQRFLKIVVNGFCEIQSLFDGSDAAFELGVLHGLQYFRESGTGLVAGGDQVGAGKETGRAHFFGSGAFKALPHEAIVVQAAMAGRTIQAVQFQMISDIAAVYGVELSTSHVKMIGGQMVQMLLKLGMVEAATSLIAGLFKSTLVGYAAGGAVQCVSMAYLTHISGLTFREYFAKGQSWGDGGMRLGAASAP